MTARRLPARTGHYLRALLRPDESPALAPLAPGARYGGHVRRFATDPLALLLELARGRADLVRVQLGPLTGYVVTGPELTGEVLVGGRHIFSKRTRGFAKMKPLLGEGLLTAEDPLWRRQRRIIQPAFGRSAVAGFRTAMVEAAVDAVAGWPADGTPFDVSAGAMAMALQVVSDTLFGTNVRDEARRVSEAVESLMRVTMRRINQPDFVERLPLPARRRSEELIVDLQALIMDIVDRRRRGETAGDDLLQRMLDARDEETGAGMSDEQLRDEVMTLFLAGHETTANALAWTFALLSLHPVVRRRLEEEVDGVLAGRLPEVDDLARLPYTLAVVKESMRLYPPAWSMSRHTEADTELGGFPVRRGELVILSPYAVHHNPRVWDNPEGFDPDRFLPDRAPAESSHRWIPFGAGPRHCIGKHFALQELHLMIAVVAQRVRLDLVPGHDLSPEPLITLRPRHGVWVTASRR